MALTLRFLGQASRQASQIATPTALTPRALASGAASGAVSPRTPRSPRMSVASAGEQLPCFGSCVDFESKPTSRQGSFVGGMDKVKTPPGSFLGDNIFVEGKTLPGFGGQEHDMFASFVEDEHTSFLGEEGTADASTRAGSSRAAQESPQFGDLEDVMLLVDGATDTPVLLGRRKRHEKADDCGFDEGLDTIGGTRRASASTTAATDVCPHLMAAQAAHAAFMARQTRRSGRRLG